MELMLIISFIQLKQYHFNMQSILKTVNELFFNTMSLKCTLNSASRFGLAAFQALCSHLGLASPACPGWLQKLTQGGRIQCFWWCLQGYEVMTALLLSAACLFEAAFPRLLCSSTKKHITVESIWGWDLDLLLEIVSFL